MSDLISRQDAIDMAKKLLDYYGTNDISKEFADHTAERFMNWVPPAQLEPLTDKEQRIFLAAMEREENVCEEVDRNYVREPYEDSLVSVCREIKRKVKGALWTI